MGKELGVRYLLQVTVRNAEDRLRISVQLVEAETGRHVWGERFDRGTADVFELQDEIPTASLRPSNPICGWPNTSAPASVLQPVCKPTNLCCAAGRKWR